MKRFLIIVPLVLMVAISSMDARVLRVGRKPLVEFAPKVGFLIKSDLELDLGADVIFNPTRNLGFRFNIVDIHSNGGTTFFLNYSYLYPTFDVLIYFQNQPINPYAYAGLGFVSHNGSVLTLKGGAGFDFDINRNICLFVEPGLLIMSVSNHDSDTDIYLTISGGVKFGTIR